MTTSERYSDGADVGDILVSVWGYDQTNVDYYRVERRTKASVWIVRIGQRLVEGSEGFMSERVMPDPTNVLPWDYDADYRPRMHLVKCPAWNDGRAVLHLTSYSSAHAWEGRPSYQSHYA